MPYKNLINNIYIKYKFFIFYIIFGTLSLFFELLIRNILIFIIKDQLIYINIFAFFLGLLLSFYLNFKFNFKVIKKYFLISFISFFLISIISYSTQQITNLYFSNMIDYNYEIKRLIISSIFFIFFYFIHIKFSFKHAKQVGIAIYPEDNYDQIFESIKFYPNFMHLDLVDSSFKSDAPEINYEKINLFVKKWFSLEKHLHVMSKYPFEILKKIDLSNFSISYLHVEGINKTILHEYKHMLDKKKVGLAFKLDTNIEKYIEIIDYFDHFLFLSINNPGVSGQIFQKLVFKNIDKLKKYKNPKTICIDGGINKLIADIIENTNYIVSSSYVLQSKKPINTIESLKNKINV